jgi:hypothetical protein
MARLVRNWIATDMEQPELDPLENVLSLKAPYRARAGPGDCLCISEGMYHRSIIICTEYGKALCLAPIVAVGISLFRSF